MNNQYQEDSDSTHVTGLGKALRQGRESKNFSVSRVADGLHLRPSIVTSIEDENYELLPGDLFLKGYIRSYARLVGLDEEKMINLLDQRLSDQANEQTVKDQALTKAKRKKHSKHAVLILFIAALVGAAFYMWSQRLRDSNLDSFDAATETKMDLSIAASAESIVTKENETQEPIDRGMQTEYVANKTDKKETVVDGVSVDHDVPIVEAVLTEEEIVKNTFDESVQDLTLDDGPSDSVPLEIRTESTAVTEQITELEQEPTVKSEQVSEALSSPIVETELLNVDLGDVRVVFSGDCWFTLKNGEGKTVYADLKREGDEINYSGPLPFKLVIGAVSVVNVFFEQEPIDFSTVRVRNNRAELELTH